MDQISFDGLMGDLHRDSNVVLMLWSIGAVLYLVSEGRS